MEAAREAGCRQLECYAPPAWRHWPLLRNAGLAERSPGRSLTVHGTERPDAQQIQSWQILPGDRDDT